MLMTASTSYKTKYITTLTGTCGSLNRDIFPVMDCHLSIQKWQRSFDIQVCEVRSLEDTITAVSLYFCKKIAT